MLKKMIFLFIVGLCFAACSSSDTGTESDDQALKPAKEKFEARCSICHSLSRPLGKNKTPAEWKKTVNRMQQKAPDKISDADVKDILDYLNAIRGPKK